MKKQLEQLDNQPRQPYKELDANKFIEEFNNAHILKHNQLEELWQAFNEDMTRTLDKLIPQRKLRKGAKPAWPWYNTRLLAQRRIVRNRENKYNKYREQHQWRAFTRERNRYIKMLNFSKRASIVDLVFHS